VSGSGAAAFAPIELAPQEVVLAAGGAKEVAWPVSVPGDSKDIGWEATAEETGNANASERARDRLKVKQLVSSAVPIRVLQATLSQLDGTFALPRGRARAMRCRPPVSSAADSLWACSPG
jgi:hypothetical protein